jgi:hypothetical protein
LLQDGGVWAGRALVVTVDCVHTKKDLPALASKSGASIYDFFGISACPLTTAGVGRTR